MARPAAVAESSEALEAQAPTRSAVPAKRGGAYTWFDDRLGIARLGKHNLRKIFPDHWSFLLGEIVLYSFIVCLLSGIFLTIWFRPSMAEVEYTGAYSLMRGIPMSEAFASTLTLSFDVRGGLLVRQVHHWAAILFIAGGVAHALRIFFTGAFRKPRELNWVIGVALMGLSLIEGFAGYSLPDDLLSGTGLRFTDGLIRSIPLVGTWAEFLIFDGEFPGTAIVPRLYMAHILLIPGILLGLIAAHMALIVYHKHTQFPGPGRTEQNVVGYPLFPVYMAKAGGFFFVVFGVTVLMGGLMQINPVWKFGPYNPAQVTAGSQPDWYMGWVEGAIRIVPNWESHIGSTTWSWNIFLPGVGLLTSLFVILGVYPFIEQWITGDKEEHHLLDRPRNAPTRTALGVAGMTLYIMFWLGGSNDIIATTFSMSLNGITWFLRIAVFVAPVIAFIITKRICLSLQRRDLERVLHGSESGEIERSPEGRYSEAHVPISEDEAFTLTQHKQYDMLDESDGVSKRRARASRFLVGDEIAKPTAEEIEAAHHHDDDDTPALPQH
ncbi:cytochrome bc1 complex cytochrome b subunit [Luteococcus sp. Sow4_B9]|uniref:cytochrome bc1 complex cytochrome b subunit n=1 Tax=Luteococcus sp. Sow4_B9 TaxID=3438792 RepID=UPI003F9AA1FE